MKLGFSNAKWNKRIARATIRVLQLGNLWRRLALPKRINNWSLTSLQQRLVKTGVIYSTDTETLYVP
jgi:hypothetical protein